MYRISTTTLEAFRRYSADLMDEAELVKQIKGEFIPSQKMKYGVAFHDIIENIHDRFDGNKFIAKNKVEFSYELITECYSFLKQQLDFDVASKEIKTTRIISIGNNDVEIVAKADLMYGDIVFENKTRWEQLPDYYEYYDSYQWRFYLYVFKSEKAVYNIFTMSEKQKEFELLSKDTYTFEYYPSLNYDCTSLVSNFLEYIKLRNLEDYFLTTQPELFNKSNIINLKELKMNIQRIRISNILGIEELEFSPGIFTEIEGKNGSGKTSVLESIKTVLNGGHDAKLLRNGAEKGEVVLILDDGVRLSKTVTEKKSELLVVDSEGYKLDKPKSYIDTLVDILSVNPIQFLTADKKNRVNCLLEAIPMKLTKEQIEKSLNGMGEKVKDDLSGHALEAITRIHKQFYDERTGVNRALKEKSATLSQMEKSIPVINYSGNELKEKLKVLDNEKQSMENKKNEFLEKATNIRISKLDEEEQKFQESMKVIREQHEKNKEQIQTEFETNKQSIQSKFNEKYLPLIEELSKLNEQYSHISSFEKQKEILNQFKTECDNLDKESSNLSEALNKLNDLKNDLLNDLPLPGLEILDGDIYYNKVMFDKLNTAKQVELSVEIAKLRAKDIGIICVDGIERLDNETYQEFKKKAIESGLQMIVTKVANSELKIRSEQFN